jgi:hypothetical protein
MDKRVYVLLKEWGTSAKAGAELQWYEGGQFYRIVNDWMKTFPKEIVENNPSWFAEKKEQPVQDTFQWTDELAIEFLNFRMKYAGGFPHKQALEYFKQSKSTPKEDKVQVQFYDTPTFAESLGNKEVRRYCIYTSQPIPLEKYPSIKKAIEEILNQK